MSSARVTRASKWPASPLIAIYSLTQVILSFLIAQGASTALDAHFIARGVLHFLSCIALFCASSTRVRNVSVLSLAASLAFLVDAGVRALAASTALVSASIEEFPPSSATEIIQLILSILFIIVIRRRQGPLFVASLAHALSTIFARIVDCLPFEGYLAVTIELFASIIAIVAATIAGKVSARAIMGNNNAVSEAKRILDDVARDADIAHVWRDELAKVRALVQLKVHDHKSGLAARSRIRTALSDIVDELYVQVESTHSTTRGSSPTTE